MSRNTEASKKMEITSLFAARPFLLELVTLLSVANWGSVAVGERGAWDIIKGTG
jgi:hypothetical protein